MIDILGVVDDPKAAETIAKILSKGAFEVNESVSSSYPFFSFSYFFQNKTQNFTVVSTNGFIFSGNLTRTKDDLVSSLKNNFEYTIPIKEIILISNIRKMATKAKMIIAFTDYSLNGDFYAYNLSTLFEKTIFRPLFCSISPLSIEESIFNMKELNCFYALSRSFEVESKFRFSSIMTNFLNNHLINNLKTKSNLAILNPTNLTILSYIFNLNFDNDNFSSQSFTIEVKFTKNGIKYSPKWSRGNLFCKLTAFTLYSNIGSDDAKIKFLGVDHSIIEKPKPLPLNYRKILQLGMKYLKLSISEIECYLKELYNEGFISFPFTNSTQYTDDFDFLGTVMNLSSYEPVSAFVSSIKKRVTVPRKDEKAKTEILHNNLPIFPSAVYQSDDINSPKDQLFLLITRHFLASISENAIFNEYVFNFEVSQEYFYIKYEQINKDNIEFSWPTIYPYKQFNEEEVPEFIENEIFVINSIKLISVKPQPLIINENAILKILQSKGIDGKEVSDGILNLISSNLIKKNSKGLKTTEFASALVTSFEEIGFDFRDTYFLLEIARACKSIREGDIFNPQNILLKKFLAMIQELRSKSQTFDSFVDLILKQVND